MILKFSIHELCHRPPPPQDKNVRSNIIAIPHPGIWFVVTDTKKFKYPYPWDSKIIQIAYPRAKAIDQIPDLF